MPTSTKQLVPVLLRPSHVQRRIKASELIKKAVSILENEVGYTKISEATKYNLHEAVQRIKEEL